IWLSLSLSLSLCLCLCLSLHPSRLLFLGSDAYLIDDSLPYLPVPSLSPPSLPLVIRSSQSSQRHCSPQSMPVPVQAVLFLSCPCALSRFCFFLGFVQLLAAHAALEAVNGTDLPAYVRRRCCCLLHCGSLVDAPLQCPSAKAFLAYYILVMAASGLLGF
ncbi:hypothetical protein BJ546DRAFT_982586, partial [Cryomyces antarcticus]